MFVIFVAHLPDNSWFLFISARFGFSSAGEVFVFCSGLASAMPLAACSCVKASLPACSVSLSHLAVYWAHIGLALGMITLSLIGARSPVSIMPQGWGSAGSWPTRPMACWR